MSSSVSPQPQHALTIERTLAVSPRQVWRCWTEPELLKLWFCPKPWFVSEARMDLKPGGEFFTLMNGPNGESFGEPGVFLAIEPERRLVFTDAFRPGWTPSGRAFMTAEITIAPGEGGMSYRAHVMHWSEEARAEHERMGFHEGWGKAADQLEALAKAL